MEYKGMGARLNTKDDRDITIADVMHARGTAPRKHPVKNITNISMLDVEDQMQIGSCVGQAEGKGEEYREYKETGKVIRLSKRFIYTQCKLLDGDPQEGTSPRFAAKILTEKGCPREELIPDENNLIYGKYLDVKVTPEILTDASGRRTKGYAFCLTLDDLKTAIDTEGVMNATLMVGDWNVMPVEADPAQGLHRTFVYGYEDMPNPKTGEPDTKIYALNSWGWNWGNGGKYYFFWSDYEQHVYDMIVYTDMPNEVIDYAKSKPYIFTRILKPNMSGDDVKQLQVRLAGEIAKDGLPCYRYQEKGQMYFSTYYGVNTQRGVERYQAAKGIVSSGTPQTTGYGQVGPATMRSLNGEPIKQTKMDLWADAIQEFEGWTPGSRSYRNNNPGNIRYYGMFIGVPVAKMSIGEDRGGAIKGQAGYCIFKTYALGREALMLLLTNAASGQSSVYKPTMTLLAFYRKYAPTADNNYPDKYAAFVAAKLGVSVTTQIGTFL